MDEILFNSLLNMLELDFSRFPLEKRVLYSLLVLITLLYPGQNKLQQSFVHDGPLRVYELPTIEFADYAVNDGVQAPLISATSAIIQDVDSMSLLYAHNPDSSLLPASTTKIMTALVALDHYQLSDVLTVTVEDHSIGSTIDLAPGEKITVKNLLYGLLVGSGNDAAMTLATHFPGGYSAFVEAMNQKGASLNLTRTKYQNPSGIDQANHSTTTRDLAILVAHALSYPVLGEIVETARIVVYDQSGEIAHVLNNTNELLGVVPGMKGFKTGWTESAGECLVSYVERNGHRIITVVLGSRDRFGETTALIDWVFGHHTWQKLE